MQKQNRKSSVVRPVQVNLPSPIVRNIRAEARRTGQSPTQIAERAIVQFVTTKPEPAAGIRCPFQFEEFGSGHTNAILVDRSGAMFIGWAKPRYDDPGSDELKIQRPATPVEVAKWFLECDRFAGETSGEISVLIAALVGQLEGAGVV